MYTITVVLDANDTPKSIVTLAALATCRSAAGVGAINSASTGIGAVLFKKIARARIPFFIISAEKANGVDGTNGAARVGFDNQVSRVVATQHGDELIPALQKVFPSMGASSGYDFTQTFLSGALNDEFQIHFGVL